jgi:2,5-dichloro-2,5-cyclohexadiene-1,4-diol dehydrogenase 2
MNIAFGSLYVTSDEARYVTGAELWIDGFWYAGN